MPTTPPPPRVAFDPARVRDAHGKTTVERFADLLLALQDGRRAS